MNPEHPIYIPSKGRARCCITARALSRMKVPFHVVVEPQEHAAYAEVLGADRLLVLPFGNLGQGSIPARNWIWEHARAVGHARHWVVDDNILAFYRYHQNVKMYVCDGTIFKCAEDFVARYDNVPLAGFNYLGFVKARFPTPAFTLNTRIYSCLLLTNQTALRWRGKFNEDTDLSLRFLKEGQCTVLFNAFLAEKVMTQRMAGGNTDELYVNGTREKSEALVAQHADVARLAWKFGRWHHHVDYTGFKQQLRLRPGMTLPSQPNEYGMKLVKRA